MIESIYLERHDCVPGWRPWFRRGRCCLLHSGCVAEIEASMRSCGHHHGHPIAGEWWSTPSAYSLWRSLLLFRSRGDRILPMCPSPTTSSSPGWPAWISPLLPSTSLPRARRSATMDPPAGGSREPAVLPCCSGEKVTWLSVHEEWSLVKYLYTWPLLLIHVHGEEQTTAHSCFVPLLCATLLEVTFSYLSML